MSLNGALEAQEAIGGGRCRAVAVSVPRIGGLWSGVRLRGMVRDRMSTMGCVLKTGMVNLGVPTNRRCAKCAHVHQGFQQYGGEGWVVGCDERWAAPTRVTRPSWRRETRRAPLTARAHGLPRCKTRRKKRKNGQREPDAAADALGSFAVPRTPLGKPLATRRCPSGDSPRPASEAATMAAPIRTRVCLPHSNHPLPPNTDPSPARHPSHHPTSHRHVTRTPGFLPPPPQPPPPPLLPSAPPRAHFSVPRPSPPRLDLLHRLLR